VRACCLLGNYTCGDSVDDRIGLPNISVGVRRRQRRRALLRIARQFAAESDPERVMHAFLTDAQQLLGANGGIVGRWDEERQVLIEFLNTITGAPSFKEIRLGEGATGQAAALRTPVIVNDYQRFESAVQESLQMGVQAVIAAPLLHGGRLLGVVTPLRSTFAPRRSSSS